MVTTDFRGYHGCYQQSLESSDHQVTPYIGLRTYHLPTRLRRLVSTRLAARTGSPVDRNAFERRRLDAFLRHRNLGSTLVLFINGQQLADNTILDTIRRNGGRSALWLLDDVGVLPTADLDLESFDLLASYSRLDSLELSCRRPCAYVPQGFDGSVVGRATTRKGAPLMVGSPGNRRMSFLQSFLASGIDIELIGRYWPDVVTPDPHVEMNRRDVSLHDVAGMSSEARVCLNVHQPSSTTGINPRTFEIAGAGGLLVSDNAEVGQFFEADREALLWSDDGEVPDLVRKALRDEAWARRLAEAGLRRAQAQHTLTHRFAELFKIWGLTTRVS
ncbi:MAG: CgeB family protein [Propionibacteriaceae bacterium]